MLRLNNIFKEIKDSCVKCNEKGGQKLVPSHDGQIVTDTTGKQFSMDIMGSECDGKGLKGNNLFLAFMDNGHGESSSVYPLKQATGEGVADAISKLIPETAKTICSANARDTLK